MRNGASCDRLEWNETYVADTEETLLIRSAIVDQGLHAVHDVVTFVAEMLFKRDCGQASPLDGFGIFRHWYVAEVERLVERLRGTAVRTSGAS
jgi:hypothetical protein